MDKSEALKVGSTIWKFDLNHRVYIGVRTSPDYRSHWVPCRIQRETTRSWVTNSGDKVPKKGSHDTFAFAMKEVDDDVWRTRHRRHISDKVYGASADQLRRVAEILNYDIDQ